MIATLRKQLPLAMCLALVIGGGVPSAAQTPLSGLPSYGPSPGPPDYYPSVYTRSRLGSTQSQHVFHWPRPVCVKCARPSDLPFVQTISAPCGPFEQGFIQPLPLVEEEHVLTDPPAPLQTPPLQPASLAPAADGEGSGSLEFPIDAEPRSSRQPEQRSLLKVRS